MKVSPILSALSLLFLVGLIIYIALSALSGCAHNEEDEKKDAPGWQEAKEKIEGYEEQIGAIQDGYGFVGTRCDSLTFTALLLTFSDIEVDISQAEVEPGKWLRHPEECYANGDSRSEASKDGYLMVLHWIWTRHEKGDESARVDLQEIIDYGEGHDWIMGEGDKSATDITTLRPFIHLMAKRMGLSFTFAESDDAIPIVESHNGHIIALAILLHGRVSKSINEVELTAIRGLTLGAPTNPIYLAIQGRFTDGYHDALAKVINDEAPFDIPIDKAKWGWGSGPDAVTYLAAVGIAEGR